MVKIKKALLSENENEEHMANKTDFFMGNTEFHLSEMNNTVT